MLEQRLSATVSPMPPLPVMNGKISLRLGAPHSWGGGLLRFEWSDKEEINGDLLSTWSYKNVWIDVPICGEEVWLDIFLRGLTEERNETATNEKEGEGATPCPLGRKGHSSPLRVLPGEVNVDQESENEAFAWHTPALWVSVFGEPTSRLGDSSARSRSIIPWTTKQHHVALVRHLLNS